MTFRTIPPRLQPVYQQLNDAFPEWRHGLRSTLPERSQQTAGPALLAPPPSIPALSSPGSLSSDQPLASKDFIPGLPLFPHTMTPEGRNGASPSTKPHSRHKHLARQRDESFLRTKGLKVLTFSCQRMQKSLPPSPSTVYPSKRSNPGNSKAQSILPEDVIVTEYQNTSFYMSGKRGDTAATRDILPPPPSIPPSPSLPPPSSKIAGNVNDDTTMVALAEGTSEVGAAASAAAAVPPVPLSQSARQAFTPPAQASLSAPHDRDTPILGKRKAPIPDQFYRPEG